MKKALILAYDFPPLNSIGAQRPYSWLKYLKEFDIEPVVITRYWNIDINKPEHAYLASDCQKTTCEQSEYGLVIRTPFQPNLRDRLIGKSGMLKNSFRKVLSLLTMLLEYDIQLFDNKRNILREAKNYLAKEKVDVIIATGEPFILFSYAQKLSRWFGIPWVADYRDGWSGNYNSRSNLEMTVNKLWISKVESRVVKSASVITTTAPALANDIKHILGENSPPIHLIYNGYFEEKFEGAAEVVPRKKFTISHAGTLYYFQRVETFISGLNQYLSKNPDAMIDVNFFGLNFYPEQISRISKIKGLATVNFTDKIPHDKMIRELCLSHVQLLLATPEKHQIYGKVFDYLATGRPILMVENDDGPLSEILANRTNARICSSPEAVCEYLTNAYEAKDMEVTSNSQDNTFTRRNQAKRFAELIHQEIKNEK